LIMRKNTKTNSLKTGKKFLNAGKFKDVIRILEPEIFRYRESFLFYKILGMACICTDDVGGGSSYLSRALQLKKDDVDSLLGLAVVSLKRMKPEEAIKQWLEVIEIDPGNSAAKRGLNLIRTKLEPEKLVDFIESNEIYKLLPSVRSNKGKRLLAWVAVFALLLFGSSFLIQVIPLLHKSSTRPEIENFLLPVDNRSLLQSSGNFKFTLSEKEIRKSFNTAKSYFLGYRDNLALVELNRILNSNASIEVKNTALSLKEHIQKPSFSTFKDGFSFLEITSNPVLYQGCYILWEGRVGSLAISKTVIAFNLWVGNEKKFEGVVPVTLAFPFELQNGQSIEILGEIKIEKDKIIVNGKTIHILLRKSE
jgi:hypothetical protein